LRATSPGAKSSGPPGGAQAVDLDLGGEDLGAEHRAGGEGDGVVRQVGKHAAVHPAVLPAVCLANVERELGPPCLKAAWRGAEQAAEGLGF